MPLLVENRKISVANSDIKCYKLFKKVKDDIFTSIYSKYDSSEYKIGDVYSTGNKAIPGKLVVGDGFFHFWKNLEDSIEVLDINTYLGNYSRENIVIIECIIPKGTSFYTGMAGCYESLASPVMKLNKVVNIKSKPKIIKFENVSDEEIDNYYWNVVSKE